MEYVRVTEVLRPFNPYDAIPKKIIEMAATRGTAVHELCAGVAKNAWIGPIDDALHGYMDSFKAWVDSQVKDFVIVEERFNDDIIMVTGQVDMVIVDTQGLTCLVDLKTCHKPQKTHNIQIAAYKHILGHNNVVVDKCLLVYLHKDGGFPSTREFFDMEHEWTVFQAALTCHNFFKEHHE